MARRHAERSLCPILPVHTTNVLTKTVRVFVRGLSARFCLGHYEESAGARDCDDCRTINSGANLRLRSVSFP